MLDEKKKTKIVKEEEGNGKEKRR